MAHTPTLSRLLDLAETSTASAAASLGAMNRQLQQHEERLQVLVNYRNEYQQRLRHTSGSGVDAAGLRNFVDFLERLEQAIRQQHALVVEARTRVDCGRSDWQLKQHKSKAYGTLVQRVEVQARRQQVHKEQKSQDEFASRAIHDQRNASSAIPATTDRNRR
jgi:flagellar protein FliJ